MKIRMLDLFCGAGGSAVGYHRAFTAAGLDVDITGVDVAPQPHYPFAMRVADAMTFPLRGYDFIHASPPCQEHTTGSAPAKAKGKVYETGWMLGAMRQRLYRLSVPWILENVNNAPMRHPVMLCGSMFGLRVIRHRLFDSSHLLYPPSGCHHTKDMVGVYGNHVYAIGTYSDKWKPRKSGRRRPAEYPLSVANAAMGIDWMNWTEIRQAIPPAYTEWLGAQIAQVLMRTERKTA
jgi:DNA (cytosine-5)-methyltransferase 1